MYFLNSKFIGLNVDPDINMTMTEWKTIPDQVNDRVAQIVCAMQMITTRPVALGVLSGLA